MALVVQKYGGTSVGTTDRIKNVAKRIIRTYDAGNDLIVVVSAMSGETNKLVALANQTRQGIYDDSFWIEICKELVQIE